LQENLKSAGKGFEKLLGVHTRALEDNSKSVVEILELLSQKQLSVKDKNVLKKINRELKGIDKVLDSLGKDSEEEQEDWFGF
jgi:hypothetical protein